MPCMLGIRDRIGQLKPVIGKKPDQLRRTIAALKPLRQIDLGKNKRGF